MPRRAWNAREILHALMETGDVREIHADGSVTLGFTVPAALLDELCAWNDAGAEDEMIDEAAQTRFGGCG